MGQYSVNLIIKTAKVYKYKYESSQISKMSSHLVLCKAVLNENNSKIILYIYCIMYELLDIYVLENKKNNTLI